MCCWLLACVYQPISLSMHIMPKWLSIDFTHTFCKTPKCDIYLLICSIKRKYILDSTSNFDHQQTKWSGLLSVFVRGHSPQYLSIIKCIACSMVHRVGFFSLHSWLKFAFDLITSKKLSDSTSKSNLSLQSKKYTFSLLYLIQCVRAAIWNWYTTH